MLDSNLLTAIKQNSSKLVNSNSKPHPDLNFDGYIKPFKEISNLWWKKAKSEVKEKKDKT